MGILSRYERRILVALTDSLFPKTELLSMGCDELCLADKVDGHLAYLSRNFRLVYRAALILLDWGAVVYRGRPFRLLPEAARVPYLRKWQNSFIYSLRLLYRLLTSFCYMNYYANPEVYTKLGFQPPQARPRTTAPKTITPSERDFSLEADVCVIGAGAGGAVVAKELAEKGRRVVLLEEGGYSGARDWGDALEVVQKLYRGAGSQITFGFPCIVLPTGKAVGGTTIINSGTCYRLPDKVIHRWRQEFGLAGLSPEGLKPYFDRVEQHLNVTAVSDEILGNNARVFQRGLRKLGLDGIPLRRNVRGCVGSGVCCFGCPTDAKQSVQISYIPRAVECGTELYTGCRVDNLISRGRHGATVQGRFLDPSTGRETSRIAVHARVVVLAAGTLMTPYLLRKSQIAHDNPHVGRHMTIHPAAKTIALFDEEIRGWEGVPQGYSYEGMKSEGLLFEGVFLPPALASIHLGVGPIRHKQMMEKYANMASFGFMYSDEGRGWIRWLPNGDPITYYSIGRREVPKFLKGLRFICEVYLAAGARKVFPGVRGIYEISSEQDLKKFDQLTIRRNDLDLTAFHPLGTCRMGSDPGASVVDGYGELHRCDNIFIADGSIFPSSLGVNPQETIMAFATRTADYIHRERLDDSGRIV